MQRRWTSSRESILKAALDFNANHCEPSLTPEQVASQVDGAMKMKGGQELAAATVATPAPPPEPVDLAVLLDRVESFIKRYMAMSDSQRIAVVLWVAHCHALDATSTTPYLHVTSAEAESGKSRLLETIEPLVPTPMFAASMTSAVLYRAVERLRPTLLIDEADNQLRDKTEKAELVGLLNAGYRRGAKAYRIGGARRDELESFETFCAKVVAGLDDLVSTLASRCLRIELRRRRGDERVSDFFYDDARAEAEPMRASLEAWASSATDDLRRARPARLGIRDRLEEALRLLLAIAESAGGDWPARSRSALLELAGTSTDGALSERTQLLADVRSVFVSHDTPTQTAGELATANLLGGLLGLEESPWRGWWGVVERDGALSPDKGAARKLANRLRKFGVRSHDIGPEGHRRKGYRRADFDDAWSRYLPASPLTPESLPREPRKPHEQAENRLFPDAQPEGSCADTNEAQTRMVEPPARQARQESRGSAQEGGNGNAQPLLPGDPGYVERVFAAFTEGHVTEGEWHAIDRVHRELARTYSNPFIRTAQGGA